MPELPEVQTIVNDLNAAGLVGRVITKAGVYWPKTVATPSPADFCRLIKGQAIRAVYRRAKLILFEFNSNWTLGVHLRMTGRFGLSDAGKPRQKHEHVILDLDDGRALRFHDTRKFGRFQLVADLRTLLNHFGPEPLEPSFTSRRLSQLLRGRQRPIKPLLLDQAVIAGLGNIYVDEALWAARLHPLRRADSLNPEEVTALHRAIRRVLRTGLRHNGTTLGSGQGNFYSLGNTRGQNANHLKVFRRTQLPCPRCGAPIVRLVVGQRSSHVCRHCQLEK